MEHPLRQQARGYLQAAHGGLSRPDKFTAESLFQLAALAIEGFWISWLEDHGEFPSHHALGHLLKAASAVGPVPDDLRRAVQSLDRFQKLCEFIPLEPRKPVFADIPGILDVAAQVEAFTAKEG